MTLSGLERELSTIAVVAQVDEVVRKSKAGPIAK